MVPVVKNLSTKAGDVRDVVLIPVSGRSPEKEMLTHFVLTSLVSLISGSSKEGNPTGGN